ncbi:MAG TPA: 6,7-dimethyl-8-ribityllumazine synthase [Gammaproteobacteria bacterium]|nr:6,7-dimethyl-8-ribityllumazine synthase [Gammaproteobacteria bacterium]
MDGKIRQIEGEVSARGLRVGIVAARFNDFIVDRLVDGAVGALLEHGAEPADLVCVRVPGAFEIPVTVRKMADSKRYDAIVALACVIRGATPHFDYVAGEASRGLASLAREHGLALGFGVLTCDTLEQAIERAGSKGGNKGVDAALTAIRMASVFRQLDA